MVAVLEAASGEHGLVEPAHDLVNAYRPAAVGEPGDPCYRVMRVDAAPLLQPIGTDLLASVQPILAVRPVDIKAQVGEQRAGIALVVSRVDTGSGDSVT